MASFCPLWLPVGKETTAATRSLVQERKFKDPGLVFKHILTSIEENKANSMHMREHKEFLNLKSVISDEKGTLQREQQLLA